MPSINNRMFTIQCMFAVLMLLHGLAIELSPNSGVVGFMRNTYGFHAEIYGGVFFLMSGIMFQRNLLPATFALTLTPLIFHAFLTWYYTLFVAVNTTLSPAIWITFIVSIGVVSVFKGTYNDMFSSKEVD